MTVQEFKEIFPQKYKRTSSFVSGLMLGFFDALTVMLCIGAAFFIVNWIDHSLINFRSFITYSIYLPLIIIVFYAANLYPGILMAPSEEVKRFAICAFLSFMGIAMSVSVETDERMPISIALMIAGVFATVCLPLGREFSRHVFGKQKWWGVPAVIYTNGEKAKPIIDRLQNRPDLGYRPAIIIDSNAQTVSEYMGIPVFPPSSELHDIIDDLNIKVAILCEYGENTERIMSMYRYTIMIPHEQNQFTALRDFGGILGYSTTHNLTKPSSLLVKRIIDLLILLVMSPIVVPVSFVVAVIVKLTSPGPIFYGHKRVGKDGKEFKCWKFRSMVINADKMLDKILAEHPEMREEWERDRKFANDPRVTKIGKILRKTSIDELPQLWNVLVGEMSFIGPRPVTEPELARYGDKKELILSVLPGLSGMWQISGRSATGYEERVNLDLYYIQNWSVWLDLWIILKTAWVVLKGKGAY